MSLTPPSGERERMVRDQIEKRGVRDPGAPGDAEGFHATDSSRATSRRRPTTIHPCDRHGSNHLTHRTSSRS